MGFQKNLNKFNLNLDSRPGKVMKFWKMCPGHVKFMKFQIFILLVLTQLLIKYANIWINSCFHLFSIFEVMEFKSHGKVKKFCVHVSVWTLKLIVHSSAQYGLAIYTCYSNIVFCLQAVRDSVQVATDDAVLKCLIDMADSCPKLLRGSIEEILQLMLEVSSTSVGINAWGMGGRWEEDTMLPIISLSALMVSSLQELLDSCLVSL